MRLLRLIWANSIRLLTQPGNIIFLIGVPVGILLFQNLLMSGDGAGASGLMVQNLDRGVYAEQILEDAGLPYEPLDADADPLEGLDNYTAELVYIFPEDFSEQIESGELPAVRRYARDESPLFDSYDSMIDQALKQRYLGVVFEEAGLLSAEEYLADSTIKTTLSINDYEVSFLYVFAMLMIVYFIILFSSSTGTDLLELREQKVTSRMFVSPNRSIEIMVSLAVSYFLLTFISYGLTVVAANFIFDMQEFPIGMTLLIIGLMSLFSLSLSLFTAKVTKNRSVVQLIPTLYGMLGFVTTLYGLMERVDSGPIITAAYATPIYWIKEMMINGDILKNTGIILLMCLVLLTAGSYNLRSFVEE